MLCSLFIISTLSAQEITNSVSLTEEEKSWISEHPVVKASNNIFYAPFDFVNAGLPAGFSIDYLNLLASKVELKIKYVRVNNESNISEMIMSKELDIIHTYTKSEERSEYLTFSGSYLLTPLALYGRIGSQKVKSMKDLENKRIGIIKNQFIGLTYKKKHPDLNYVEFNDNNAALRALASNIVDVFPGDVSATDYSLFHSNIKGLEIIGDDLVIESNNTEQRMGVHKDNLILLAIINKAMAAVSNEEYDRIVDKWITQHSPIEEIGLTDEEKVWISEHPVVKASNSAAYAPFDFASAGLPAGLSIDYLNLIAPKVGFIIDYVDYENLADAVTGAYNKEIDIIHSIAKNEEREKKLLFSKPYFSEKLANYGRVGSDRINEINDLKNLRIGIVKTHLVSDVYKKNYSHFNLIEFSNYIDVKSALLANEIDVFTGERSAVDFYLSQNDIHGIEIIGNDFVSKYYNYDQHMAVQKDNQILANIINKGIAAITEEEFNAIAAKWIQRPAVSSDVGLTEAEIDWLAAHKTILTSSEMNSYPYEFINMEGKIDGLAGDFLKEISKRLHVEFVWAGTRSWNEGIVKIKSGEADIVSAITPTKDREEYLTFTDIYETFDSVIFSRAESTHFTNMASLSGYSVAQVKGTVEIDYLENNHPNIRIIQVDQMIDALNLLSNGEVDAVMADILRTSPLILENGIENIIISGVTSFKFGNAIGIRNDLPLLASSIQKALADISPSRKQEITDKWALLRFAPKMDYGYLWEIIGFTVIILFIFLFWNSKLMVARKEALEAKSEAEKANEAKSIFLANISHELRTPLNSLLLLSNILQRNNTNNLTDKQLEHARTISQSGFELLHLIDEILDLSKIEAQQITVRKNEIDFQDISDYLEHMFQAQMDEASLDFFITIDAALPDTFISDKKQLYQIIKNLIANALKFTKEGSVTVAMEPHKSLVNGEEQVKISVTDTGIGIKESDQERIFDAFSQSDESTTRNYGGTGLGLSISRKLADLLQGNITLESSLGNGSTFSLFLPLNLFSEGDQNSLFIMPPLSTENNDSKFERPSYNLSLKNKTILLVDDDEKNIFSLSEVLKDYGINSIIATSGPEAIEELNKNTDHVDLVLMDMMMPGMDGDEAIKRIRFMERFKDLPIIAVTANAMPED